MSDNKVNDTIVKMIQNLTSNFESGTETFSFGTSLKRPLSSTSNDSQCSSEESEQIKRPKLATKMDLNYIGSPREMRRLRTDLLENRNTISILENQIQRMHGVRKEMQIMYESETKALKRQHETDTRSIEELEAQLQSIRQREIELKAKLAEVNNKYNVLKVEKDDEIQFLEKSFSEMKEESRICDSEENSEIMSLNRKYTDMQMLYEAAQEDAEAQKQLVSELERQLAAINESDRELEKKDQALQAAKLRIKELEYAKENYLEFQHQAKAQTLKLANYADLEKKVLTLEEENNKLKDIVKNKLILEEEVFDLKTRLVNFREQEKKLANLQAKQLQAEMYLDEWRTVARTICESTESDSCLPHLLRTVVEKLQHQEISLTAAKVELESELATVRYEAKTSKAELEKCRNLIEEMKKTSTQKQTLFHRMQKKLLLVSRERDSYRQQLDSYEKDLTMNLNSFSTNSGNNKQLESQRERIDTLEKIIESYRELNVKLEADLQNASIYADGSTDKIEEVAKYQEQIDQLKLENEMLKQRRDQLEIQLENHIVGQDTVRGGQVYHLINNPLSECLQQRGALVEKHEQEIDRLRRKIKALEEGKEASKLNETDSEDIQSLKEKVKSHESEVQRLKDYFKSSMQEFRNVVYMLLGYKIDRTSTSLYKLTSIYAERAQDHLCFQLNNEGALNLLENEFSAALENLVSLHLRHQKSIPLFLSAITVDLYNNSTVTTNTFQIDE